MDVLWKNKMFHFINVKIPGYRDDPRSASPWKLKQSCHDRNFQEKKKGSASVSNKEERLIDIDQEEAEAVHDNIEHILFHIFFFSFFFFFSILLPGLQAVFITQQVFLLLLSVTSILCVSHGLYIITTTR